MKTISSITFIIIIIIINIIISIIISSSSSCCSSSSSSSSMSKYKINITLRCLEYICFSLFTITNALRHLNGELWNMYS